ncbi:MAG: ROK family protein [Promicromonosporaceae bacterium]|nr:ROK family protein [Promicromonosporaceae bacterium]
MTDPRPEGGRPTIGVGAPVLAFDVGGTTIKAAYLDSDGMAQGIIRVPSPDFGPESGRAVIDTVAGLVGKLTGEREAPVAIGLTLPGVIDDETGFATWAENLGWRNVDFAALAAEKLSQPVAIGHDVRAAGTAEMALGAGRGHRTAVMVALGTGVSAAVFVNGRPVVGGGYAGEIGHAVVVPGGETCVCGNLGCLEAISSAASIARRYNRATGCEVPGSREVVEAMEAGDPVATAVWNSAIDALVMALSHVVSLIQPEIIILGGGLAEARERLLGPVRERLAAGLRYVPTPKLVRATAGEDAGLLGAALLARRVM